MKLKHKLKKQKDIQKYFKQLVSYLLHLKTQEVSPAQLRTIKHYLIADTLRSLVSLVKVYGHEGHERRLESMVKILFRKGLID